jgi:predicted metal-dependent enzyme (double-stranded beta helix superfamily)
MTIMPHNHRMWAVIGVYTGREGKIFWRRVENETGGLIEAAGAKSLGEQCAEPLGRDVIHSVTNPLGRLTAAIQVCERDFYGAKRSDWDPRTCSSASATSRCTSCYSRRPTRSDGASPTVNDTAQAARKQSQGRSP